ncbi:MAG: 3-hydroxyacyl-CoA dehydrogenase, FabG4 [uncultured Solirubrobacteraceae bacterium]|uniref:3-hydroxyacyl-CoA dehydrogenase, FabG4 n=1 Tax=uncultured Solirubrobacteraceae bacterium TaxID=1162706 RepID=A0A6J4SZG2_9ACTN|nr:MAG: 3-hydroxyacyl-CoA dehydrogenase, FabG4 [uncultured Solirubrobacteraceae bacterium]
MTDLYTQIANSPVGKLIVKNVGLPQPVALERFSAGDPVITGPVKFGAAPGGRLVGPVSDLLQSIGVEPPAEGAEMKAVVFDATGIETLEDLDVLQSFFSPVIRRVQSSGRIVVLGGPDDASPAQRALEGFTRSVAKESRRGATANLVRVEPGAEDGIVSTLRFFLSSKSAYVDGQVVRIDDAAGGPVESSWEAPLAGKVALVTGASRGIGAAIASTLARDGAHVVGLDIPALLDDLDAVTSGIGGSSLALDITEESAPRAMAAHLKAEHGGVDVVVHNAGITRDRTLGRMDHDRWRSVLDVNVIAPQRITAELTKGKGLLRRDGRVVGVSSISGIAGNGGQTNYATSKAAVIGLVSELAPALAQRGVTINAVAPGFIETEMTAKMPVALREGGRRMNSLSQGGLPVDVAEAIAWLGDPASGGVNGNVIRVCGQSMIGA